MTHILAKTLAFPVSMHEPLTVSRLSCGQVHYTSRPPRLKNAPGTADNLGEGSVGKEIQTFGACQEPGGGVKGVLPGDRIIS
jgi:hypothetical protein